MKKYYSEAMDKDTSYRADFLAGIECFLQKAKEVINAEFPEFSNINVMMPDESNKRVGQSIAAASLPEIL